MGRQIVRGKKKGRPSKADLAARRRAPEEDDEHPGHPRDYQHHLQSQHKRRRRWSEDEEETQEQRDLRRSLRRRNAVRYNLIDYDEDYWEGEDDDFVLPEEEEEEEEQQHQHQQESAQDEEEEEEEEDEDERREKKLKLVVKLPSRKISSNGGRSGRNGGMLNGVHSRSRMPVGFDYEDDEEEVKEVDSGEGEDGADEEVENEQEEDEEENRIIKKRKIIRGGRDYEDDDTYEEDDEDRRGRRRDEEECNRRRDSVPGTPNRVPSQTPIPEKKHLELILDKLQKKDTYGVYAEPVDPDELPDYHDIIEHPMDFGTVRKKLANREYSTLEQFESDIYLICSNAMQYNAPDTIYHKQARAIKELAEKKFQRVRMRTEQMGITEAKSPEQKTKPSPIVIMRQARKAHNRSIQEPANSDVSAGATLAARDVHNTNTTASAGQSGNCARPSSNEVQLMEGISALPDRNNEKAEDLQSGLHLSGKGQGAKLGRKALFVVDENRRETYDLSNQPMDRSDQVLAAFEDEQKLLIPVGLYGDHSYAQSLARFAATLGPVAWKMASKRIQQSLPPGLEFGRGWIGQFEPVSTPLVYTAKETRKTNPFVKKDLQDHSGDKVPSTIVLSNECRDNEPISNGKPSFLSYSGGREPTPPSSTVAQQQFQFLGKPQQVAVPMKMSNESLPPVATMNERVKKDRPALDGNSPLLSGFSGGSNPAATTPSGASHMQHNAFIRKLWNGSVPGEGHHNHVQRPVPSKECPGSGHMLESKPSPHLDSGGSRSTTPCSGISKQRNPFSRSNSSDVKVSTSPALITSQNSDKTFQQQKRLHHGAETAGPRNLNFLQSMPFRTSSPSNNGGATSGGLFSDEKKNTRRNVSVDINQPASSSSSGASPSHSVGMTKMAFPPRQDQGLSDPVQVMKSLAQNAQNLQNNNNRWNSSITPTQFRPSVQSPRGGGGSNMGGPAPQAARAWMHVGSESVKPSVETSSAHNRSLMSTGLSSYNTITEVHRPQMSQPHLEANISARMHFQSEKMNFLPFQSFIPQPAIRSSNEAQVQQQRPPMLFPQLMMNDGSRGVQQHVQLSPHHWRGISPQTAQQKQKQDTLKPDLNIAFQSTVDSQQPDLALQL